MIEHYFETLGFNDKQTKVYLSLAETGKATASFISKRCDIPRSTVYALLDSLVEKGVVSLEHSSGTTYYVVNDTESFTRMLEREEEELKSKFTLASDLAQQLIPYLKSSHHSVPKLQYFEGKRNIDNMLFQFLPAWRKSFAKANDHTVWGVVDSLAARRVSTLDIAQDESSGSK